MRVLMTGGGTAGHINPALAIADIIKQNAPDSVIEFVGVRGRKEEDLVPREGYKLHYVEVMGIQRSLSPSNIKALWLAFYSPYAKSTTRIIEEFHPDLVIGTGGYACWPIMKAAVNRHIPTAVHESNALPGLAVRRLQKQVDRIWINFARTADKLKVTENVVQVGNPLRGGFGIISRNEARAKLGIRGDQRMILSYGGSLGAEPVNLAVIDLMKRFTSAHPEYLHIHAAGKRDYEETRKRFDEAGLNAFPNCVLTDYIYDMPIHMAAADLVISRAGAMTLSELARMNRAAILIPSPHVTDNHQYLNAKTMADAEAALLIQESELPGGALNRAVEELLNSPERIRNMTHNMDLFADRDANKRIWEQILELTGKGRS